MAVNPISNALDALTDDMQAVVGAGVHVTRDPAAIGPQVASKGVAVLVGPATVTGAATHGSWFLAVPVSVVFDAPADPRHIDPAYTVAAQILDSDYVVVGMDNRPIQLDAATTLPAATVTLQATTEC